MTSDQSSSIDGLPESCYCPVTNELMSDPCIVDAPCCHTLARESALQWFDISIDRVCPICGVKLRSLKLTPNAVARDLVAMYEYTHVVRENAAEACKEHDTTHQTGGKKNASLFGKVFRRRNNSQIQTISFQKGRLNEEAKQKSTDKVNNLTDKQVLDFLLTITSVRDIVQVMVDRPLNAAIQGRACHRLVDVSRGIKIEENDDEQEDFLKLKSTGAIRLILASMKNFSDSLYVQKCACWALYIITYKNDLYRREVVQNSGLSVIMNSIRLYGENDENIAVSAYRTLENIIYRNFSLKKKMIDIGTGITDLTASTLFAHLQSEYVLESICSFLCELYNDNKVLSITTEEQIVSILIDICVMFPSSKCSHLAQGSLFALGVQYDGQCLARTCINDRNDDTWSEKAPNKTAERLINDVVQDISDVFFNFKKS